MLSILYVVHHPDHVIHLTKLAMKDYPDVDLSDPQLNNPRTNSHGAAERDLFKIDRRSSESGLSISLLLNETCLKLPEEHLKLVSDEFVAE